MGYWNKQANVTPSKHDHVGHMLYSDTTAVCTAPECEQAWDFDKKLGWVPIVGGKPLKKEWTKKAAPVKKKVERLNDPTENYMSGKERDIFERINRGLKKKNDIPEV